MRGTLSNDGRIYFYEPTFLTQGENGLKINQLQSIFIKNFLNDHQAKYMPENYTIQKEARLISIWRKDRKVLSEDELLKLDVVIPQITETY